LSLFYEVVCKEGIPLKGFAGNLYGSFTASCTLTEKGHEEQVSQHLSMSLVDIVERRFVGYWYVYRDEQWMQSGSYGKKEILRTETTWT
jgi:hypothetical protein